MLDFDYNTQHLKAKDGINIAKLYDLNVLKDIVQNRYITNRDVDDSVNKLHWRDKNIFVRIYMKVLYSFYIVVALTSFVEETFSFVEWRYIYVLGKMG